MGSWDVFHSGFSSLGDKKRKTPRSKERGVLRLAKSPEFNTFRPFHPCRPCRRRRRRELRFFSLISVAKTSVVKISEAIEAAFCNARARHFHRVNDAGVDEVDVFFGHGVEADAFAAFAHAVDDNRAFQTGVDRDLAQRLFQRAAHDVDADLLRRRWRL